MKELLSLFLSALGVKDHLLLSLNKTNRFCKLLCSGAQRCQLWWDGGGGAVVGSGGVAGSEAGVAFGVERRGLSGFFSDRSFGAALTAGCRGSAGGTVDVAAAVENEGYEVGTVSSVEV